MEPYDINNYSAVAVFLTYVPKSGVVPQLLAGLDIAAPGGRGGEVEDASASCAVCDLRRYAETVVFLKK